MSIDDMDRLEEKEMKKKKHIESTWYEWVINFISESIRKNVGGFKDKVVCLFKTNTLENYSE